MERMVSRVCGVVSASVVLAASSAACDPVDDICRDGAFDGSVIVLPDRFRIEGSPSLDIAFEDNPFDRCTDIFEISFAGGPTDDRFFSRLDTLAFIGPDAFYNDSHDGVIDVESIDGFDGVTSLEAIGGEVRRVTGFNHVTSVGALTLNGGHITGFNALEEAGELSGFVGSVEGLANLRTAGVINFQSAGMTDASLPSLEVVHNDFTIEGTGVRSICFPKLSEIGGTLFVDLNTIERWQGFAPNAHVAGDFLTTANAPVTNEEILGAMEAGGVVVDGTTVVCQNGGSGIPDPTCPH